MFKRWREQHMECLFIYAHTTHLVTKFVGGNVNWLASRRASFPMKQFADILKLQPRQNRCDLRPLAALAFWKMTVGECQNRTRMPERGCRSCLRTLVSECLFPSVVLEQSSKRNGSQQCWNWKNMSQKHPKASITTIPGEDLIMYWDCSHGEPGPWRGTQLHGSGTASRQWNIAAGLSDT